MTEIQEVLYYKKRYYEQRGQAKGRGIEWQFTYESWIAWWGEDIVNRGPRKGQLVMARFGDTGPYHPDNVRKLTAEENVIEGHFGKSHSDSTKTLLSMNSSLKKRIQTPYGVFDSRCAAARHIGIVPTAIGYRLKKFPTEYYYIGVNNV
jgi:hypothetical protein